MIVVVCLLRLSLRHDFGRTLQDLNWYGSARPTFIKIFREDFVYLEEVIDLNSWAADRGKKLFSVGACFIDFQLHLNTSSLMLVDFSMKFFIENLSWMTFSLCPELPDQFKPECCYGFRALLVVAIDYDICCFTYVELLWVKGKLGRGRLWSETAASTYMCFNPLHLFLQNRFLLLWQCHVNRFCGAKTRLFRFLCGVHPAVRTRFERKRLRSK